MISRDFLGVFGLCCFSVSFGISPSAVASRIHLLIQLAAFGLSEKQINQH